MQSQSSSGAENFTLELRDPEILAQIPWHAGETIRVYKKCWGKGKSLLLKCVPKVKGRLVGSRGHIRGK